MKDSETITINGLINNISVLEKDNASERLSYPSCDKIYNDQEPINFGIEINEKVD
jgi:hypothetical protein